MADTNFVAQTTRIPATWLNDLNQLRYGAGSASRGTALLEYIPAGTGAISRTTLAKLREHRSVLDFGAIGDGVNDDTAEIQAGIDAVETAGGGTLWFPKGTYKVSATLLVDSNNVNLVGDGLNTVITRSGDYGNTIKFSNAGSDITSCGLSHMQIKAIGLMSSGAHIWLDAAVWFRSENLHLVDGFIGMRCSGPRQCFFSGTQNFVSNLYGGSVVGRKGFLFDSTTTPGHPSPGDTFFTNLNAKHAAGMVERSIEINSADGIWIANYHTGGGTLSGVYINASDAAEFIGNVYLINGHIDLLDADAYGLEVAGSINKIFNTRIIGARMNGANIARHGVFVPAGTDVKDLKLIGVETNGFRREGMKLLGGRGYKFTEFDSHTNSEEGDNLYSGIYLENVIGAKFVGGQSGERKLTNQTIRQKNGIEFGAGNSDIRLIGMDLTNNLSGSIGGGANQYRAIGCDLDGAAAAAELTNLVAVGGYKMDGATHYLDGNALTGIADSKKGTFVAKVRFATDNAATEVILDSSNTNFQVRRLASGSIQIVANNAALTVILNQSSTGFAIADVSGTYTILASWDLAVPGSMRLYVDDLQNIVNTTFTNDTAVLIAGEYSVGGATNGTSLTTGDFYMIGFAGGVYIDFDVEANRRKFFDAQGNLVNLGASGVTAFGVQPHLLLYGRDFASWKYNQGSGTGTFTEHGTPATATVPDYAYPDTTVEDITVTRATHTVGRTDKRVVANLAGTVTLTMDANTPTEFTVRTITANTVVSASVNVVPIAGGAAGTAILAATAGKYAKLRRDGSNWQIIEAN